MLRPDTRDSLAKDMTLGGASNRLVGDASNRLEG